MNEYNGRDGNGYQPVSREEEEIDNSALRLQDAFGQFTRYGSSLESDELLEVVETLTDINDSMAHGRTADCVREDADEAKKQIDAMVIAYSVKCASIVVRRGG